MTALENVLVGMHSRLGSGIVARSAHAEHRRRSARPPSAPASCSLLQAARAATTSGRGTSPTATSAGSRWRARSRRSRSCCLLDEPTAA
jgi:hypothetical protein